MINDTYKWIFSAFHFQILELMLIILATNTANLLILPWTLKYLIRPITNNYVIINTLVNGI